MTDQRRVSFTQMKDGTREEYELLHELEAPHLAGTASGLGGAIMLGGGAALSAFAGTMLTPGTGATTLMLIMFVTASMSVVSIFVVIARERQLRLRA